MNILIFSHSSGVRGGGERALLDIIDGLPKNIKPTVCIPSEGELVGALRKRGVSTIYSGLQPGWDFTNNFTDNMESLYNLLNKLKLQKAKYDLVVSNSSVYPWGGLVARELGVPHVWIIHEIIQMDSSVSNRIDKNNIYSIGELSETVLANSKATAKSLEEYIPKGKLKIQYLPIRPQNRNNTRTKGREIPNDMVNILCLGRVIELKRQVDVVEAVNLLDKKTKVKIQVHFVGEVDEKYLKQVKKSVKNNSVTLLVHGHLEDLSGLMAKANIGIVSSDVESFGRATYEMLADGIPVIGTNSGATPELIEHEKNGYLYKVGDTKSLAMYIKKLVNDTSEYKRVSTNALKIARTYNYDDLISGLVGHLKDASKARVEKNVHQGLTYLFLKNNHNQLTDIARQGHEIEQLEQKLEWIYSTKTWKTLKKAAGVKRRLIK